MTEDNILRHTLLLSFFCVWLPVSALSQAAKPLVLDCDVVATLTDKEPSKNDVINSAKFKNRIEFTDQKTALIWRFDVAYKPRVLNLDTTPTIYILSLRENNTAKDVLNANIDRLTGHYKGSEHIFSSLPGVETVIETEGSCATVVAAPKF